MSPIFVAEILKLHPVQQAAFHELLMWGSAGTSQGFEHSDIAVEKALEWARQVPIPPEQPKEETEEE